MRHSTYYLGTLPYTITSDIPGFPALEDAPALFWRNLQGAETVYKWRQAVMEDWGKRLQYLKD